MKTVLTLMFGFGLVLPSHAGFDGLWLRCLPEWNRASPVMLLEIDKIESKWLAEWGNPTPHLELRSETERGDSL